MKDKKDWIIINDDWRSFKTNDISVLIIKKSNYYCNGTGCSESAPIDFLEKSMLERCENEFIKFFPDEIYLDELFYYDEYKGNNIEAIYVNPKMIMKFNDKKVKIRTSSASAGICGPYFDIVNYEAFLEKLKEKGVYNG